MIRLLLGLLLAIPLAAEPLRVGIIGDQSLTDPATDARAYLQQGVAALRQRRVQVVLHTGDLLLTQSHDAQRYAADFAGGARILDTLGVPWHLTPGDHDLNPLSYVLDSPDRTRVEYFFANYSAREKALTKGLWHSFDLGGYHFVSLNSLEHLHADVRWGSIFLAKIGDEQFAWLERDLAAHRHDKGTVVWLHQPLWYHWAGWQRVHELLRRHKTLAVVAGHFHYAQDEGMRDGIRYLVVGATGARTKQGTPNAGALHHVTVLALQGRQVGVELVPLGGAKVNGFNTREDMDRVQALDIALDTLAYQMRSSKACVGRELTAAAMGNPIDVPVRVTVRSAKAAGTMQTTQCDSATPDACTLAPGARMAIANNSSVEPLRQLEPLWRGVPAGLGAHPFRLEVTFRGAAGDVTLHRDITVDVQECAPAAP